MAEVVRGTQNAQNELAVIAELGRGRRLTVSGRGGRSGLASGRDHQWKSSRSGSSAVDYPCVQKRRLSTRRPAQSYLSLA